MNEWIVGSNEECDIVVALPTVSGWHCRLVRHSNGFWIEDLGSTNGTYCDGVRIEGCVRIEPGDRITLGLEVPLPWPEHGDRTGPRCITIGRDPTNDVVVDDPTVSSLHARVTFDGQTAIIEDLGSVNGLSVGDPSRPVSRAELRPTDVVFLGKIPIPASQFWAGEPMGVADSALTFEDSELVLGRDITCGKVLDFPMVSARHARLVRNGKEIIVEDLASTNGTFVNGRRIDRPTPVRSGDRIALGSYTLTLQASGRLTMQDNRGSLAIEARAISVDVPGARLLEDVSLTIRPSEFVGLMGPSGAGKSTLMAALNGYSRPTSGSVLVNGKDLYAHYDRFRGQLGYVPQEDIIHRDLTVGQALYYTARLRLPPDYTDAAIRARIRDVLAQLGLGGTENVRIGTPEKRGISGGQRKRVNLALELMTDPSILFLDEPTSGLSSEDTLAVMRLLRKLADEGKTILLTIHQPSLEAFRLMDNLVVIAKEPGGGRPGRLVYYGRAYPDAVWFFNPDGIPNARPGTEPAPDEILRGLARGKVADWATEYGKSPTHDEFVASRAGGAADADPSDEPARAPAGGLPQWWTLFRRMLVIKAKDRWNTAILLAQAPLIAAMVVLVFGDEARQAFQPGNWPSWATFTGAVATTIFDIMLAAIWFGCSNAAREIVSERAIYRRERMVNLGLGTYLGSKFAVLGGLCAFQCAVLLGIVYWGSDLQGPWPAMYGLLLLTALVGLGIGLLVSALARTPEMAIALVPLVILPMLILGGAMQPIHRMGAAMRRATLAVPSRWSFEGLLSLESERRPRWEPPGAPAIALAGEQAPGPQDLAEHWFPQDSGRHDTLTTVAALASILALLAGASALVLKRGDLQ